MDKIPYYPEIMQRQFIINHDQRNTILRSLLRKKFGDTYHIIELVCQHYEPYNTQISTLHDAYEKLHREAYFAQHLSKPSEHFPPDENQIEETERLKLLIPY